MENWKKELRSMKLESIKQKSPGFFELSGGYKMKTNPYNDLTANNLTKAIIDFINFSGGDANRINTQGQKRKINGRELWTYGGTRKGTADIHGIYRGRAISIEIKIGRDKPSEAQLKEAERVRGAGGLYFIARDMPSFLEFWKAQFESENIKQKTFF